MTAHPASKRSDASLLAEMQYRLDRLEHHVGVLMTTVLELTKQGDLLEGMLVKLGQQSDAMEELLRETSQ